VELHDAAFLPDPDARLAGWATIDWIEGRSALVIRQGDQAEPAAATWINGRDEGDPDYVVLYADDRGVSRRYHMTFDGALWEMWRDTPGFSQRYSARIEPDGRAIRGRWEKSSDQGSTWEHDFRVDYARSALREEGPTA
jgi:hypothetical protein